MTITIEFTAFTNFKLLVVVIRLTRMPFRDMSAKRSSTVVAIRTHRAFELRAKTRRFDVKSREPLMLLLEIGSAFDLLNLRSFLLFLGIRMCGSA